MRPSLILAVTAMLLMSPTPASAVSQTHTIILDKMNFGPVPNGIRVGDRIVWMNKDMFRHTATAKDGSFDVDLPPGKSAISIVRKAGAILVVCRYHPAMRAALTIAK